MLWMWCLNIYLLWIFIITPPHIVKTVYNTPHHRHQLLLNIFKQREVRKYFYLFSFHRDKNVNISTPSQSSYLLSWVSEELLGNVFQRKQMCSLPCAGLSLKHALKLLKNNKIFTVLPPGPRVPAPRAVWRNRMFGPALLRSVSVQSGQCLCPLVHIFP